MFNSSDSINSEEELYQVVVHCKSNLLWSESVTLTDFDVRDQAVHWVHSDLNLQSKADEVTPNCLRVKYRIPCVFNPLPNKPWFLCVCSTSLLKRVREKEKLHVTSAFSFSHSVFYLFGELSAIFIKLRIIVCN